MWEHYLQRLVEETTSYNNSLVNNFFPTALWPRLPHVVQTFVRNYIVSLATYFLLCSLWCFYFYHWKHDVHLPKEDIPSRRSIIQQIKLAMQSMPCVTIVPTISEYFIEKGYTKCYFSITEVGLIAYITHIIVHLILVELWIYWIHRAYHDVKPFYKHFHFVHHRFNTKTSLSPFAGVAGHPVEAVLNALSYTIFLFFVPMHFTTEIVLISLNGIWTFYLHGCLETKMWPFLTSDYHTMHHIMHRYNYGNYTILMDWCFGTLRHPVEEAKLK
ncbi:hypothetical protein ARALYDRAFT_915873 [Arabidopsis lyrata subsp. lyrata]|uniref:Fatty acid hydroxylase domain-containing protein n=1 Tax=Arabidopsis lyrata subsp. lyrata TaxID=81972 RepID=D7MIC3_ARALL|nr:delta(7)-sterol-C5(6)-desaturase [Arabidopsis lyrata subsp. lyrata]EFH44780.1 hypothetical protein ARALYDRAFT_915873 [Arabidopsis lyrata subsp. lyrata]|eukprot:XP_002868521.1 delta(7)-sterol-C5(6)-desaturase [Arabidopsis lyrata subsp. lyrata]